MEKADIKPKLRLAIKDAKGVPQSTGPHTLIFVKDKLKKGIDPDTQEPVYKMKYYFKDTDGLDFEYSCPMYGRDGDLHYLVQKMAPIEENTEITLEMKRGKGGNYIEVKYDGMEEAEPSETQVDEALDTIQMDGGEDEE